MALLRDPDFSPAINPLLQDRWSPRAFDEAHVLAPADLGSILEAARWTPSAGNSQPWSFIVGLRGDSTHEKLVATLSRGNSTWAPRASALILTAGQVASGPDHELPFDKFTQYDLGQSAAHLTIQAHGLGLHAHQMAGFDHAAATEAFGVPEHWKVTTLIAIGKVTDAAALGDEGLIAREEAARVRRPLAEFVFSGAWGETPLELGEAD